MSSDTSKTRLYVVENGTKPGRLVEAASQARAERHVATPILAHIASQFEIVELMNLGVEVERAGEQVGPPQVEPNSAPV